jgi:glycosyltransferase involved in cell wall biosynthesis
MNSKVLFKDRGVDVTQDLLSAIKRCELITADLEHKNPPLVCADELVPNLDSLPNISIGLITFRRDNLLNLGLNSLVYQNYPKDKIEIIIINDGTGPSTRNIVKKYSKLVAVKYYEIDLKDKPYPYYYDMRRKNFLIKNSMHEIFMLTQAEIVHLPNNLRQVAAAFQNHDGHILVKPRLIEQRHECKGQVPGVNGDVLGQINFDNLFAAAYSGKGFMWSGIRWSGSFGSAMRRSSYNELGGYEEDVQISIEAEMYSRILKRGWKIIELNKAHMVHLEHERDFKGDKWLDAVKRVCNTPMVANHNKEWGIIKEARRIDL